MPKTVRFLHKDYLKPSEHRVLKKFDLLKKNQDKLQFVHLDSAHQFSVELKNCIRWKRLNPKPDHSDGWEIGEKWEAKYLKFKETGYLDIPTTHAHNSRPAIESTDALVKCAKNLKAAYDELQMASGADRERRATISRDFYALIESCRNFEDVIAVWPEANKVTDKVIGLGQQVSLMSSEAIDRIHANMATREVKID